MLVSKCIFVVGFSKGRATFDVAESMERRVKLVVNWA